jgi:hypothetical protein
LFTALADKPTLRAAFFDWLALNPGVVAVGVVAVFPHRDVARGAP